MKGLPRIVKPYGIILTQRHLALFDTYLDELERWNKRINLTGITSRRRMLHELLVDSLIPSPYVPDHGYGLDLGSGAGFPAIPIKILHPDLVLHLVEVKTKKVAFLKHATRILNLDGIQVIHGRIEDLHEELRDSGYHIVTARAVSRLSQNVVWCAPHVRFRGILIGFLGPERNWEIENKIAPVLKGCGLTLERVIPYRLPGQGHMRNTVIFRKTARPSQNRRLSI